MATSKKKVANYDNESITALKGADRVRKRPGVIFGSNGLDGCEHSIFEIISNSVDEAREGFGNVIEVTVWRDKTIEVTDYGRGVPLEYNEKEGRFNWELIYCELYAGGKYNNNEGGNYEYSLGLNGLGACATQYSSEFMDVRSYKNGLCTSISFKKGEAVTGLEKTELTGREKNRTGTVTRWRPDLEVFTDINIPREHYSEMLRRQSVVNSGIKFVLKWETDSGFETEEYCYDEGITDYLKEKVGESAFTTPVVWKGEGVGRDREDKPDYKFKLEVVFCATNTAPFIEYYHNSSFLEHGGSPDKAVKAAFTYAVDKYLRDNGKYSKSEAKVTFADIEDCLALVSNSFSTETSYENQTKKSITNAFITKYMTDFLKKSIEIFFIENPIDADKFTGQALINKRSRESADRERLNIKKKLTSTMDISNRIDKFVSCRSNDPEKRELYIVEGDSALTSCKLGRAAEFQAIFAVRGKTLNCLKSTYDRIFKSEIIVNMLKVIGCGVELSSKVKGNFLPFSMDLMKWNKIIICTDADEDGFQIRTLILTVFYRLLPTLIREGKVYIAESPLFEITTKDDIYFAYNEWEKADIMKQLEGKKYTLQRSKGLGENEPEMMWKTTMNPATRRLIRVDPADEGATYRIFDTLLGDNLDARKEFIREHGSEYASKADI